MKQEDAAGVSRHSRVDGASNEAPISLVPYASKEKFTKWLYHLEIYFKTNNIDDPMKKYSLLMVYGGSFLKDIVKLHRPRPTSNTQSFRKKFDLFAQTKELLQKHYTSETNVNVERIRFRNCLPSVGDTHTSYLRRLREIAGRCNYEQSYSAEKAVCEQFVDKCINGNLKARLIFEPNLTMQKIQEISEDMRLRGLAVENVKYEDLLVSDQALGEELIKSCGKDKPLARSYNIQDFFYRAEGQVIPDNLKKCGNCGNLGHLEKHCLRPRDKKTS